jgi:hypothetical protein
LGVGVAPDNGSYASGEAIDRGRDYKIGRVLNSSRRYE